MAHDDPTDENERPQVDVEVLTSRRRFLEATGAAGLVGGIGGFAMGQAEQVTTFEFGGKVSGWVGQAPDDIAGEQNPTLELEAGAQYEVVWTNLDGAPHNFTILDADGEKLMGTETMSDQGATRMLTFTATEEMAEYVCRVHPSSMVGDIQVGGEETPTAGTETPQPAGFVPEGPTVGARLVADGPLTSPVTLRTVPGPDDSHVIVDQTGQLYLLQEGELQEEPLLDVGPALPVATAAEGDFERPEGFDERGLLGLAFHPEFEANGRIFLRYSAADPVQPGSLVGPGDREFPDNWDHLEVLAEFQTSGARADLEVDPDSERVLLEIPSPQFNHNGGEVTFGPDGYLYTSVGDGGGANDTGVGHAEDWHDGNEGGNAQNVTDNLLGSIIRVDVDAGVTETPTGTDDGDERGDTSYGIPGDNPLVDTDGMDELYAWGLRNPWRMSFNDGMLVAADVGQELFEEVDVIENGGNYGWNVREGFHCFDAANPTEPLAQCPVTAPEESPFDGQPLLEPVIEYPHTYEGTSVGISITGGYVYQGDEISDLAGQYVFGDWSSSFSEPKGSVYAASSERDGMETPAGVAEETTAVNGTATGDGEIDGTGTADGEIVDTDQQLLPSQQPWTWSELQIAGGEDQGINRFINAFGRDAAGNVYVLASRTGRVVGEPGEVYQLVPAGEGDEIDPAGVETPLPGEGEGEEGDGAAENETMDTETQATETPTVDEE